MLTVIRLITSIVAGDLKIFLDLKLGFSVPKLVSRVGGLGFRVWGNSKSEIPLLEMPGFEG